MLQLAGLEGFGGGLNQGLDIAARIQAMHDAQRMGQARAAVGASYGMPQQPMPQPPMPGQSSAPAPQGPMGPDPMMGPGPMPGPGPMGLPSGGAPPPPGPPQPMPMAAPAGPAMGAGGAPLSGTAAPGGDAIKDAQSTITAIAQQIKAANPNISPEQLFDATGLQIEQMKGVRNDVKDYMTQQIELAKLQTRIQTTEERVRGQVDVAGIQADARVGAANIGADSRRDVAGTQAGARVKAAEIGGSSRERVAGTQADARRDAAGIGADSREAVAGTAQEGRRYAADQGRAGRENAAGIGIGKKPTAGKPAAPKQFNRTKAGSYASAEAVRSAFQAGKIDQNTATSILKRDFGMK